MKQLVHGFIFMLLFLVNNTVVIAAETQATVNLKTCKIEYPKASLMNEEQGIVTMTFVVNADGTVVNSKIDKSSGFKNLDKAALNAIAACKFKPGTTGTGTVTQTSTTVQYVWKLDQ